MMQWVKAFEEKCTQTQEGFDQELQKIRTSRAHPGVLEHVMVSVYGQMTPLKQVASIGVQDARTLSVTPWDKQTFTAISKAIQESDLGLNPQAQSDKILVPMPMLTEERRKEWVKCVRQEGEKCKVSLRHHRRDALAQAKAMVKQKEMTEDEEKRFESEVDKVIERFSKLVDSKIIAKEKELLAV